MRHARHFTSSSSFSRRQFLRAGAFAAGALALGNRALWADAAPQTPPAAAPGFGKAKSIIQLWLWGGPSQIDTFDPKPNAGPDYAGAYTQTIPTNVDGIVLNSNFPELAKIADKYSLLRGMTHGLNSHETAAYLVQTGRMPGRDVFPCAGAVVSYFKGYNAGYDSLIPPYVVLTQPLGRFSEAGFLGTRYKPFATGGDPSKNPFAVEGIVTPGMTEAKQRARRDMLGRINTFAAKIPNNPAIVDAENAKQRAYELILGDAGKVFDLQQETKEMRDRYGKDAFGQSCLCARRLVEAGVPYVAVNYRGWDDHKQIFAEYNRKLPMLDKTVSTLILDLEERGLLDSTIIWMGGEFGRTPEINFAPPYNGGRGHYGAAFCNLVAGGGFKGGYVVGKTDERAEEVVERPIYPCDMIGSLYHLMGIPVDAKLRHPQGEELPVIASTAEQKAFVDERKARWDRLGRGVPPGGDMPLGILKEIM